MKNIIALLVAFFISATSFTQDINIGVEAKTEINVEDISVEAVREMYRMESLIERDRRIREVRNAKLANWINKELIGEDLSNIKYILLMPLEEWHDKASKRLKKNWAKQKGLPEFVNIRGKHKTHKVLPPQIKQKPENVLYMYIKLDTSDINATQFENYLSFDTYIELYDFTGRLVYANSKLNTYYFHAVNKLIGDYQFATQFN